jgi:signal transduction histidine kinase
MDVAALSQLSSAFARAGALIGLREIVDDDLVHLVDNPRSAAVWGRAPHELVGERDSALGVPVGLRRSVIRRARRARDSGVPRDFELSYPTPSGLRSFVGKVVALEDEVELFFFIAEDVTDERRFTGELMRFERLLGLSSAAAHGSGVLRDPTTRALLALSRAQQLVATGAEPGTEALGALREAVDCVERIGRGLRDLSELSNVVGRGASADVEGVVRAVVGLQTAGDGERRFSLDLAPAPRVACDATRLAQVLTSLIERCSGEITIALRSRGDRIELRVEHAPRQALARHATLQLELELCRELVNVAGGQLDVSGAGEHERALVSLPVAT